MTALTAPEDFHDNALWAFSLRHYARPGVKASCLALQDAHGLDVNVALACLWHEHRGGRPMSEGDIERLLAEVSEAQRRVWSLRPLRREAKEAPHGQALYRALKRAELLAENLLQRALFEALHETDPGPVGDGRASLLAYASHLDAQIPAPVLHAFTDAN